MIIELQGTISRTRPPRLWKNKDGETVQTSYILIPCCEEIIGITVSGPVDARLQPGEKVTVLAEADFKRAFRVEPQ